jgi:flotillin
MVFGIPAWIVIAFVMGISLLLVTTYTANHYHKAAPNEALIVYGFRGPRVIVGGGTVIYPLVENYQRLSLEPMSFEVAPEQHLHTSDGAIVSVEAAAQVKVKLDLHAIQAAAEWFLSKTVQQREELIRQLMESRLRTIIAHLTVEQIVKQPEKLADQMRESCAADINKMGMEMVSFRIKEVREQNNKR